MCKENCNLIVLIDASVAMEMQNKLSVVSAERFDVISRQIRHSIELITALSSSFKFSEPIFFDPPLVNKSISSDFSNFVFCEPLKQVDDEKTKPIDDFVELLSLLNIYESDQSNIELQLSTQQGVQNNVISDDSQDIGQIDVGRTLDINPDTQVTHLYIDNNEHNPSPQTQYDKQPLPLFIKHVQRITWPNQDEVCYAPVMHMFGQTFDAVMIYGIVTSLNIENGGLVQRFVIDDGSGSINVVWKANNNIIG